MNKYYCIDCKAEICRKTGTTGGQRCPSCAQIQVYKERPELKINRSIEMKERLKNPKNHPNYKHGKTCQIRYCKDCGRQLGRQAGLYNNLRCKSCWQTIRKQLIMKSGNPNWQGGLSFEPYTLEWTKELREQVRDRDSRICQNPDCGCSEDQNGKALEVHHIDYDKENSVMRNLISLCKKCHIKSNYNRDYWYALFMYLMDSPKIKGGVTSGRF